MCHYYWNRVRRIGVELLSEFAFVLKKMLFSIHKICIEIEEYITTVWNPEQNVESINTIYQNSVLKSSTYQKWMSNTVKALRRRMAPPCCVFFCFYGSHYGGQARVYSLCRALLHLYGAGEWVLQRMLWEAAAGSGTIDPFLF